MPNAKSHRIARKPLSILFSAGLLGMAASLASAPLVHAQAQPAKAEQKSYRISAGPLKQSLNRFASEAGITLSFEPALVEGKAAPALNGSYTPARGLEALLQQSDLVVVPETGGGYRIQAMSQNGDGEGPLRLKPIQVEGWRSTQTRGYRPGMISSATKTDSPIVDIPISVSVVTADVIADQNATSVGEALRNVAGVEAGPNLANVSVQEEFTIRGFTNSFINVNGVERRSTGPLSTANIESIEVIKGPSSVLTGDVSPGGLINIQTKRPEEQAAYEFTGGLFHTTTGSGTEGRFVADATGPINDQGSILYRFIASADGGNSFIDTVDKEQYLINPMVSFLGLEGDLRVDVDLSYLRNDDTFQFGIPFRNGEPDGRIGRTSFLASKDNKKVTEDYGAEIRTEYAFTDATKVDAALTYHLNEHKTSAQRSFPDDEVQADDTFGSSLDNLDQESYDLEFEANVIHNLSLGSMDWRLLAGGDLRRSVFQDNELFFALEEPDIDVLNPSNDARLPRKSDTELLVLPNRDNTTDAFGFYAQAEVWVHDRIKFMGGIRYDDIEFEAKREGSPSSTQEDDEFTPRAGLLVKATQSTSVYGSYSRSFEQQNGSDAEGNPFAPTEGEQWEFGVKQELFDGGLLATFSAFTVTQEDLPVTDPSSQIGSIQIGEIESEGFEFELKGQVNERLRLTAGYTFLDNDITKDPLGNEGNRLRNVPEHQANAFALYDVFKRKSDRLTLGGGIFYTGDRYSDEANTVELKDFVTVDLTAQYELQMASGSRLEVQAGAKNLFDETFFEQGATRIAFRGEPRTLFTKITLRF